MRADESVIALANNCPHLRSLGLYFCQHITDRAMYSLAQSRVKNKHEMWASMKKHRYEDEGLMNLNISQCTALTPPAVQAVCEAFPALHTCPERHSLIISGCLNLTSVHCACSVQAHRARVLYPAHWVFYGELFQVSRPSLRERRKRGRKCQRRPCVHIPLCKNYAGQSWLV